MTIKYTFKHISHSERELRGAEILQLQRQSNAKELEMTLRCPYVRYPQIRNDSYFQWPF